LCATGCCGEFPDGAGRVGSVAADQKTTNYIIGLSFTAEMEVIAPGRASKAGRNARGELPSRSGAVFDKRSESR
jgi:hypothetical protein